MVTSLGRGVSEDPSASSQRPCCGLSGSACCSRGHSTQSLPVANPTRFERGILGVPKSTKDTGGCQVFVMHRSAAHLDGANTAFGRVADGVDVVDRLLVGDRTRSARVETPAPAPR